MEEVHNRQSEPPDLQNDISTPPINIQTPQILSKSFSTFTFHKNIFMFKIST